MSLFEHRNQKSHTLVLNPGLELCIHSYDRCEEYDENHDGRHIHVTHYKCMYCPRHVIIQTSDK